MRDSERVNNDPNVIVASVSVRERDLRTRERLCHVDELMQKKKRLREFKISRQQPKFKLGQVN